MGFGNKKKKIVFFFILVAIIASSFGLGIWYGKSSVICNICPPQELDFSLLWESYHKLQEKFVNKEKIDPQKIIYGAISGMTQSLEDPYTVFFPPEETKKFMEDVKGSFEGVGMEIGIKKNQLQVIAPLEGTPAQKAGLRAADKILKINETLTDEMTVDEAVSLIRGKKGTEVLLTVFRDEWEKSKEFKIKRDVIKIPSLKWEVTKDNIAYLKLHQFSEKASIDFRIAAMEILKSQADSIILDLRNNPGGYLEVAQYIAGWFLEKGQTVVIEDFGEEREDNIYKAEEDSLLLDYPIVVLINQGSASASEILAGALRDNRKVLLIGEKSFGKGSVQELVPLKLKDGASLKVTIAKWLTPKGNSISEKGLEPDIAISISDEDFENNKDPQMEKAIEVLKEIR